MQSKQRTNQNRIETARAVKVPMARPLLRRAELFPGESLGSLIERLNKLNGYEGLGFVGGLAQAVGRETLFRYPHRDSGLERLVCLTGIDPVHLHAASPHVYAEAIVPSHMHTVDLPDGRSLRIASKDWFFISNHVAYCPACLRQGGYQRLSWIAESVLVCLQHKQFLSRWCPRCLNPISISDLMTTHCHQCQADLTQAETPSIATDVFGLFAQRTVQSWLKITERPRDGWSDTLPRRSVPQMWSLYSSLCSLIDSWRSEELIKFYAYRDFDFPDWSLDRNLQLEYAQSIAAVRAMINWPSGLYEFLDVTWEARSKGWWYHLDPKDKLYEHLGHLSFLRCILDGYVAGKRDPFKSRGQQKKQVKTTSPFIYVSLNEVARQLDTYSEVIKRLIGLGRIEIHDYTENRALRCCLVKQNAVRGIMSEWHQALTLPEAAEWFGLPESIIRQLVELGELKTGKSRAGYHQYTTINRQSAVECLVKILWRIRDGESGGEWGLTKAVGMVACVDLNAGQLLQGIIREELRACLNMCGGSANLDQLTFSHFELQELISRTRQKNGWVTRRQVRMALNLEEEKLGEILRTTPSLQPLAYHDGTTYYCWKAVRRLALRFGNRDRFELEQIFKNFHSWDL